MGRRRSRGEHVSLPGPDVTDSPRPLRLPSALGALRRRAFATFWAGALVSNIGGWLQTASLAYLVERMTGDASAVGVVTFCSFAPTILLSPLGGRLADRFPRRVVLMCTSAAQGVLALLLWWDFRHLPVTLTSIGVISLLSGAVLALTGPSWHSLITELVPREQLPGAISLNAAQYNLARAIGPAVAGLILARSTGEVAFLINGISYLAVLVALISLPRGSSTRVSRRVLDPSLPRGFTAVRYARRHAGLGVAILAVGALSMLSVPFVNFLAVYASQVYEVAPSTYGVLAGAVGLGSVAGSVLVAFGAGRRTRASIVVSCFVVLGFATMVFAAIPSPTAGLVLCLIIGGSSIGAAATLNTSVQLLVGEHMRGRVLALYFIAWAGMFPIGSLVQGAVADVFGIRVVTATTGALLLAVGVYLSRSGLARYLDTHEHRQPHRLAAARRKLSLARPVPPG